MVREVVPNPTGGLEVTPTDSIFQVNQPFAMRAASAKPTNSSRAGESNLHGPLLEGGRVSNVILRGDEAIHYAAVHGMTLNEGAEGSAGAQSGLSVEQASEVARVNPGLIWVEAHIKLNSADPSGQE